MSKYLSFSRGDFFMDINLENVLEIKMQAWRKIVKLAEKYYDPADYNSNIDNAYNYLVGAILKAKRENDEKTVSAMVKRFDVLRDAVERKSTRKVA